jgi:anti-sigma B factor antagonist
VEVPVSGHRARCCLDPEPLCSLPFPLQGADGLLLLLKVTALGSQRGQLAGGVVSVNEAAPSLTVTVERQALWTVMRLLGELDQRSHGGLVDCVRSIFDEVDPPLICVDLNGLQFCDSSGVACLVMTWRAARERGGALILLRPVGQVARLMSLVGLAEVLPVVDEVPG